MCAAGSDIHPFLPAADTELIIFITYTMNGGVLIASHSLLRYVLISLLKEAFIA